MDERAYETIQPLEPTPAEAARSALNHVESSPSSALMALVGDEAPASGTTPAVSLKTPVVTVRGRINQRHSNEGEVWT